MLKIFIPGRENSMIVPSCLRGFEALGHQVKYIELMHDEQTGLLKPIDPQELLNEVIAFGPDLIFDVNGAGCDGEGIILSSYKILGIPLFVWFVDNPLHFLKNGENKYLHLFTKLVFDRFLKDKMEGLGISDVHHLPLGTDIDYFRPLNSGCDYSKYQADVSFAGKLYADRCRIYRKMLSDRWPDMPEVVNDVIDYSVKLLVNGEKMVTLDILHEAFKQFGLVPEYPADDIEWILSIIIEYESGRDIRINTLRPLIKYNVKIYGDNLSSYLPEGSIIYPSVPYFEELPKVYNSTAINLNISRTQLRSAVNQRVFDVPACRAFLLTDYSEELEDYFVIGKEVGCYRDSDELDKLVRFYIDNPHVRAKIAEAGYERAVSEHNYAERMKRVIDIYNNLEKPDSTCINENNDACEMANILLGQVYLRRGDKVKARECINKVSNKGAGLRTVSEPRISLCMIVKNEEADLPRCLDSVGGVISETIIVDTGSTDRTIEIAREYGAKIINFEWIDNFSAARNVSINAASGDWILILDADEIIAKQDIEALLKLCNSPEYDAYGLHYRNYTNESSGSIWVPNDYAYTEGNGIAGWFPTRKVRLFRNDKRIKFTGAVHEVAEPAIRQNGLRIGEAHFPVHHYGELKKKTITDKKLKYLEYGKKKIEEEPENPMAYYEYGVQCSGFGAYEDAAEAFKKTLELSPEFPSIEVQLGMSLFHLGRYKECITYLQKGISREPENPGLYNNLASVYLEMGETDKAIELYRKAVSIHPGYAAAHKNLGLAYLKSEMTGKSLDSLRKAISLNPSMTDVSMLIKELEGVKINVSDKNIYPSLSLCMIVKNEEDCLATCLESVKGVVDEVVVVDTGSTDTTCDIASDYGAKIIKYEWMDDFSAARNVSLQNATGDYILWLDADEYLSSESRATLIEMKQKLPVSKDQAFSFIIRSKREDNNDESFRRMRLFPNKPGIKFRGKVHEDVADSLNSQGVKLCNTDMVILHDGYMTGSNMQAKVTRNLPLLLAQAAEFPEDIMTSFYIANSYYCIGRINDAIQYMEKVTQCRMPSSVNSSWFPFAFIKLAQFYRESGRYDGVYGVYDDLFRLYPDFTIGHFFMGEFLYYQKKYELALNEFERVKMDCVDIYEYPMPSDKIRYLICYYSGSCLIEIGEYALAAEYFVRAEEISPEELNLYLSLSRLFAMLGDIESCVEACDKIMKHLGIDRKLIIESLEDLAGIFREIGSHLEGLSRHQESVEAYKAAVAVLKNKELQVNAAMN